MHSRHLSILAAMFACLPITAQAGDLDLLSNSVPPNVMLVFDTSGSMMHTVWHDDFTTETFDPDGAGPLAPLPATQIFWPSACANTIPVDAGRAKTSCPGSTYLVGSTVDGDTILANDICPENELPNYYTNGTTLGSCPAGAPLDGSGNLIDYNSYGNSWYAWNYLNWWYGKVALGALTAADFPTTDRLGTAKVVVESVVDDINPDVVDDPNDTSPAYTERVRFGLARFASSSSGGGYVQSPIIEGNKTPLVTTLQGLASNSSTPISEVLVDVGRYFAGANLLTDGTTSYVRYNRTTTGAATSNFSLVPASPVDEWCRQNFAVVITDGHPTSDLHDATYQLAPFQNLIANYDLDGNECEPEIGPQAQNCIQDPDDGRDDGFVYASNGSDYLDDVAAYLYDYDFDPNLKQDQNLVTYTLGFFVDNDLLKETAINGRGQYFTTGNALQLAADLKAAILDIIDQSTTFTSATVPSSRTSLGDGFYTAFFEPKGGQAFWAGHLQAWSLDPNGVVIDKFNLPALDPNTNQFLTTATPHWDAGLVLADPNSGFTRRLLMTSSSYTNPPADFVTTNLTTAELALVAGDETTLPNYPTSNVVTLAEVQDAIVDYMWGHDAFDEDLDNDPNELRPVVLGDIFHSDPIVVAGTSTFLLSEDGYGSTSNSNPPFSTRYKQRHRVIYAGGNDGMLHAFHAGTFLGDDPNTTPIEPDRYTNGTGAELFGFVPRALLPKIKEIPRNIDHPYYFVDGSPIVADAWLGDPNDPNDTTKTPEEWATVLVTGLREGGNAYLALDVTDPNATDPNDPHGPYPRFMWEFTHTRLAETWSEPIITRVKTEDGAGGYLETWVAIFGGGYSDTGNPNTTAYDPNAVAGRAFFMVDLETGAVLAHRLYDPTSLGVEKDMDYAFPATPAVLDLDFDGFVDVVYLGDLGGQLWKWDVSAIGIDSDFDGLVDNWSASIFFDAGSTDMGGGVYHYRSLFYPPAASFVKGNLVLALGTGEREDLLYRGSATKDENNRFYVVRDDDPTAGTTFSTKYDESSLSDITGQDQDTTTNDQGFFFKLADGEKYVTNQLVFAGFVLATTYVPSATTAVCDVMGTSKLYVFDVATGRGYYFNSGVTTGDAARVVTIGAGAPTDPRLSISMHGEQLFISTSTGQVVEIDPPDPGSLVRTIYWRQSL